MAKDLNDFFDYQTNFNLLNKTFKDDKAVNKFHSSNIEYFKKKVDFTIDENSIDWHFRSFRSLREIFHSSLMYVESKVIENKYCIASVFFTKYYSFLHAVKAVIYLTPIENFNPRIGHAQTINLFIDNYCQGNRKVFDKDEFRSFSKLLRDLREVTSYQMPHSGSNFLSEKEFKEIDTKLENYLIKLYQLSHYLSYIVNKVHKCTTILDKYSLYTSYVEKYFHTPHPLIDKHIDFSDKVFINDNLRANSTYCEPFIVFFEHEEDEFLLYGGFSYLRNSKILFDTKDVTSLIWKAF